MRSGLYTYINLDPCVHLSISIYKEASRRTTSLAEELVLFHTPILRGGRLCAVLHLLILQLLFLEQLRHGLVHWTAFAWVALIGLDWLELGSRRL